VRKQNDAWLVALLQTEHKRGKVWVLPKGHVELHQKERAADAARREVWEEAGVKDVIIKNQLGVSRFSFQAEEALVHKTVHYFLMVTQQELLTPQQEEGILAATWFPIDEAIIQLNYDTDKEIVLRAKERLTGVTTPRTVKTTRIHF
jgi:ADP-ribose pyrophosphatase YjhB (NUDIX family)